VKTGKAILALVILTLLSSCTDEIERIRAAAEKQHVSNKNARAIKILNEGLTKLRKEGSGEFEANAMTLENQMEVYALAELEMLLRLRDFESAANWIVTYEKITENEPTKLRNIYLRSAKVFLSEEQAPEQRRVTLLHTLEIAPNDPDLLQEHVQLEIASERWREANAALQRFSGVVIPPAGVPVTLPPHYSKQVQQFERIIRGELLLDSIEETMDPAATCPPPEDLMATWLKAKSISPSTPAYAKARKFAPAMETCRQEVLKQLESEFKEQVIEMRKTIASRLTQDAAYQFFGAPGLVSAKTEGKKADVLKLRYRQLSLSDMQIIARSDKNELADKYFKFLAVAGFRKVVWIDVHGEHRCPWTRRALDRPCMVFHPLKPASFKESYKQMLKEEGWDQPFTLHETTKHGASDEH